MRHLLISSGLLALLAPSTAFAVTVYPGCAVPSLKAGHHTFYVDPVNGSSTGDGSAAKPWHTLAEVLANPKLIDTQSHKVRGGTDPLVEANPRGPIKAGDLILLKTGNHGAVVVLDSFNKDFITVMPAPGEKPVLSSLRITSSQKWYFEGLKVMTGVVKFVSPGIVVKLGWGDWEGTTNNIIFDHGTVSTTDDTSGWTDQDWVNDVQTVGIYTENAPCVSITNNHIYNVLNGIGLDSPQSVVQSNTIDTMLNDGIDFTASNSLIKWNVIKSGVQNYDSQFHADGIQGWSKIINGVTQTVTNAVIDGNIITKTGNPKLSYIQGISIYDGKWSNLTVENNAIAVNSMNALAIAGPKNSLIINNTVLASNPADNQSWLYIGKAKDGSLPANTTIRNNIANQIIAFGTGMQVDHNMAVRGVQLPGTSAPTLKGTAGNANKIDASVQNYFVAFDPTTNSFDLRLRSGSPAIGAGVTNAAPSTDLLGQTRKVPIDLGAYTYSHSPSPNVSASSSIN